MRTSISIHSIENVNTGFKLLGLPLGDFIEVVEFSEQSISIQVFSLHFAPGLLVSFTSTIQMQGKSIDFHVTGKVLQIDRDIDKSSGKIKIQLYQYDKAIWQRFLKHSKGSQERVDLLLKKMKGVGA